MPPKKKSAGAVKKKKSSTKLENVGPSTLELSLRLELDQLEKELAVAKLEASEAKRKNDWLQAEVRKVEEETREYEAYMMRKTMQEQSRIKSLSDFNQQELDAIETEKRTRTLQFEKERQGGTCTTKGSAVDYFQSFRIISFNTLQNWSERESNSKTCLT